MFWCSTLAYNQLIGIMKLLSINECRAPSSSEIPEIAKLS